MDDRMRSIAQLARDVDDHDAGAIVRIVNRGTGHALVETVGWDMGPRRWIVPTDALEPVSSLTGAPWPGQLTALSARW